MSRPVRLRLPAPILALAAAAALGGCVAYPAPYPTAGYYGAPYGYGYAYQPATLFGFNFGGWGDHGWHDRGGYWR